MSPDNIKYCLFSPLEVEKYWDDIEPQLHRVMQVAAGEASVSNIRERLLSGIERALCVFSGNEIVCVCILGITEYETGKRVLQMPYVGGGGINTWVVKGFDYIKQIARDYGCSHVRGCGRKGWLKFLPELKEISTTYECEV